MLSKISLLYSYLSPNYSSSFWHGNHRHVSYDYSSLSDYYLDFTCRVKPLAYSSSDGVPLLKYPFCTEPQYNPCAVAQWGLGLWQLYRRTLSSTVNGTLIGADSLKTQILLAVNSLSQAFVYTSPTSGHWLYYFDLPAYSQSSPWSSCISQAQSISFLLRAIRLVEDPSIVNSVKNIVDAAFNTLLESTVKGGLCYSSKRLCLLEEIVSSPPSFILDGAMYGLFGVFDYYFYYDLDPLAQPSVQRLVSTLARSLFLFDLGYWSRADLYPRRMLMPASPYYHSVHIAQLQALYSLTDVQRFDFYAKRWQEYQQSFFCRSCAFFSKVLFKLVYY